MKKLLWLLLPACLMAEHLMAQSPGTNNNRINNDRFANKATISIVGATPSVAAGNVFVTANSSSTTITNFTGGVDNQSITVICGDAYTTIANNSNIVTSSGNTIACERSLMNVFVYYGANAQWVQALMGSTSDGSTPGGSHLRFQFENSGSSPGANAFQKLFRGVNLFEPHESTTFCGPEPWSDVVCYGWYANYSTSTGTISSESNLLSLPGGSAHFQNGEYLVVYGAGAAPVVTTPKGVTVSPSVNAGGTVATVPITGGSTTYCYQVVAEGLKNDYSAASTLACTSNGQASLGPQTAPITSQILSKQTVTVTCAQACALPASGGAHIYIVFNSTTGASQFEGDYIATGMGSTHFTYQQSNFDSRNGAPTSSAGGTVWWWNTNHVTWTAVSNTKAYHVYGPNCPASCNWIGETTRLAFDDYGTTPNSNLSVISGFPANSNYMEYGNTRPPWIPATPPSRAVNQMLSCKIGSGGGTTVLTLVTPSGGNCNAGVSVTAATALSDDGPPLVQAQKNSIVKNVATATAGAVFIPGLMSSSVTTYIIINSYTDLSSACTTFYLDGLAIEASNTINLGCAVLSSWSSGGSVPQFGWGGYSALYTNGGAYPLLRVGGGASISHMVISCLALNGCLLMDFYSGGALFHADNAFFNTNSGGGGDYTGQIQLIHSANFSYHYGPNVTFQCGQLSNPANYNDQSLDPLVCNTLTNSNGGGAGSTSWGFSLTGPIWTLFRAGFDQDWSGAIATGTNIILANNIWTQSMSVPLFMDTTIPTSGALCGGVHLTNIYEADRSEPMYAALAGACGAYINTVFNGVGNHPIITGYDIGGLEVHNINPPLARGTGDSASFGSGSVLDGTRCNNSSNCLSYTEFVKVGGELALAPTSNIFMENLPPPAPTCTSTTTGGNLSNGTYYFYFVPVYPTGGEGVPSPLLTCTISGGTLTQLITVNWTSTNSVGASGYNVYYDKGLGIGRLNNTVIPATTLTTTFNGFGVNDSAPSSPAAGPTQMSASGISAPTGIFYNSLRIGDQGSCTMTTGSCSAQTLSHTYANTPNCIATWNGTGTLTGSVKIPATTTTVTPASSVATDTAVVNWVCFGD